MTLHRSLFAALLATASSMQAFGQAAPPAAAPNAAPTPKPPSPLSPGPALTPLPAPARAPGAATTAEPSAFLPFKNASFELPAVQKRTLEWEGGNPGIGEGSDWSHFIRKNGTGDGALNIGITNEIARTGKQSIFFDFAEITGKRFVATLMTQFVEVKPKHPYKAGMWGRMDKERPLTLDQRRPFLRMQFEFYKADEETQVGDTEYRVMQIPGSLKRMLFNSSEWSQAYGIVRAPVDAALMKVSYEFNVRNEPGKTDGIIYFDDAFVEVLPLDFPIDAAHEIVVRPDENETDLQVAEKEPAKDSVKDPAPPK